MNQEMLNVAANVLAEMTGAFQEEHAVKKSFEKVVTSRVLCEKPGIIQIELEEQVIRCYDLNNESGAAGFEKLKEAIRDAENPVICHTGIDREYNIGWHYRQKNFNC